MSTNQGQMLHRFRNDHFWNWLKIHNCTEMSRLVLGQECSACYAQVSGAENKRKRWCCNFKHERSLKYTVVFNGEHHVSPKAPGYFDSAHHSPRSHGHWCIDNAVIFEAAYPQIWLIFEQKLALHCYSSWIILIVVVQRSLIISMKNNV